MGSKDAVIRCDGTTDVTVDLPSNTTIRDSASNQNPSAPAGCVLLADSGCTVSWAPDPGIGPDHEHDRTVLDAARIFIRAADGREVSLAEVLRRLEL